MKIAVSIVSYNHEKTIVKCLDSILAAKSNKPALIQEVIVTDNASSDDTLKLIRDNFSDKKISLIVNEENQGFSKAHNKAIDKASVLGCEAVLILNPDCRIDEISIEKMCEALSTNPRLSSVTPKIFRANEELNPLSTEILDACGMYMTKSLRHFDRGTGSLDSGAYEEPEYVFSGTGACLLVRLQAAKDLSLSEDRIQLFDEDFFAYREDADFGWRSLRAGWKIFISPRS